MENYYWLLPFSIWLVPHTIITIQIVQHTWVECVSRVSQHFDYLKHPFHLSVFPIICQQYQKYVRLHARAHQLWSTLFLGCDMVMMLVSITIVTGQIWLQLWQTAIIHRSIINNHGSIMNGPQSISTIMVESWTKTICQNNHGWIINRLQSVGTIMVESWTEYNLSEQSWLNHEQRPSVRTIMVES